RVRARSRQRQADTHASADRATEPRLRAVPRLLISVPVVSVVLVVFSMEFRLVQTDLMGSSEYCVGKSCRSTIHHSRTTGTRRTERQLLADAVYRPSGYDHLQRLDKSPSPPESLVVSILRRTAHPSRRGQPQENCHLG